MARAAVAVFGSSEPRPGEPLYETARAIGRELARRDLEVVTGGYGGVMEGASRGAIDAGGRTHGVLCELFADRPPNGWLLSHETAPDLYVRTRGLIERADGFVVLEGKAGTLAEVAFLWALDRAGCLGSRPVVLLGGSWRELVEFLVRNRLLDAQQAAVSRFASSAVEAVEIVARDLAGHRSDDRGQP